MNNIVKHIWNLRKLEKKFIVVKNDIIGYSYALICFLEDYDGRTSHSHLWP